MEHMKRIWHYTFAEPFTWLFYCFFQPERFKRDYEETGFSKRMLLMFRFIIPMFLCSYSLAIVVRMILLAIFPELYLSRGVFVQDANTMSVLFDTALATVLGLIAGIVAGIIFGLAVGLTFGLAISLAGCIAIDTVFTGVGNVLDGIVYGFTFGMAVSSVFGTTRRNLSMLGTLLVIVGGMAIGSISGAVGGVIGGGMGSILIANPSDISESNNVGSIIGAITGGSLGAIAAGILSAIAASIARSRVRGIAGTITANRIVGTMSSITLGIIVGVSAGVWGGGRVAVELARGLTFVAAINRGIPDGFKLGLMDNTTASVVGGMTFLVSYLLGSYRLLLFPVSSFSSLRTYLASRKNPPQVFLQLHRSSLYWDERIFLPLPYLKQTLLLAVDQSVEQTLEEVAFIVAERPYQIAAARAVSLEIAIRDLEMRESLRDIAKASQRLAEILPSEAGLIDPQWTTPFTHLNDASRDVARFCSPLGWQARREALEDTAAVLKRVHPNTAFRDAAFNKRLGEVVKTWRIAVEHELEQLEKAPEKTIHISNPYNPGPVLELSDSLFVGRRDLARQLGETLSRGSHRPTFLLNGERRFGKSSTLKQLPALLGAHYLPIHYDLQLRGISSSIDVFLGRIAEEIHQMMNTRGLQVKKLEFERLQEASWTNDAAVYHHFERWLKDVERTLEKENRTVLLAFDEFEKLEAAGQRGHIDLELLLDWFRSLIQNYPRVALLFSGVRSFADMGMNWAGYFVNVQTLKVSFLLPVEAHQLITRPMPGFPSEEVFSKGVVEEIMRVTGCHPFLVQGVCSALMDHLNAQERSRADLHDVASAVNRFFTAWWDTYFRDLWERTDELQRMCLLALKSQRKGTLSSIEQESGLAGRTVQQVLETLLRRDIITLEHQCYSIATPIFDEWIGRSSYS